MSDSMVGWFMDNGYADFMMTGQPPAGWSDDEDEVDERPSSRIFWRAQDAFAEGKAHPLSVIRKLDDGSFMITYRY